MRRRMMMNTKRLPYDAEVEWIKSTAGAYVDTGIKASGNLVIRTILYDYFSEDFFGKWIFGGRDSATNNKFGLYINGVTEKVSFAYQRIFGNDKDLGLYSIFPSIASIEIGNGLIKIGNIQHSYTIQTFTGNYNLSLFCLNTGGQQVAFSEGAKMGATYITNGINAIDLITVRKNGKGYMYDRISGELRGTGDFIFGPDKMGGVIKWLLINILHGLSDPYWEERRVT